MNILWVSALAGVFIILIIGLIELLVTKVELDSDYILEWIKTSFLGAFGCFMLALIVAIPVAESFNIEKNATRYEDVKNVVKIVTFTDEIGDYSLFAEVVDDKHTIYYCVDTPFGFETKSTSSEYEVRYAFGPAYCVKTYVQHNNPFVHWLFGPSNRGLTFYIPGNGIRSLISREPLQ